jgi:hypothetical protein
VRSDPGAEAPVPFTAHHSNTEVLLVAVVLTLAGCARLVERGSGDASVAPDDGSVSPEDAISPQDAPALPDGCSSSGEEIFYERGYCFAVDRCCTSADCTPGDLCNERGRCVLAMPMCFCEPGGLSACPSGTQCFDNDVHCGICLEERPSCAASPCEAGHVCRAGYCVDPAAPCARIHG